MKLLNKWLQLFSVKYEMKTQKVFDDGSYLEWKDRETLSYHDGDNTLDIWVDFEPGFFSSGRIVHLSLIEAWSSSKGKSFLSESEKKDIANKIKQYYFKYKKRIKYV